MDEFNVPAPAATYAAAALVVDCIAPAPAVCLAAPAPVVDCIAALAVEYIAPAPVEIFAAPSPVIECELPILSKAGAMLLCQLRHSKLAPWAPTSPFVGTVKPSDLALGCTRVPGPRPVPARRP